MSINNLLPDTQRMLFKRTWSKKKVSTLQKGIPKIHSFSYDPASLLGEAREESRWSNPAFWCPREEQAGSYQFTMSCT